MSRWLGSGQRYLYDQGEEDDDYACADDYGEDEEEDEEEGVEHYDLETEEVHNLQPPSTDTWLLTAFTTSARQAKGKRPSGASEERRPGSAAAEAAKKRQREAQKLAAQWNLTSTSTTATTEPAGSEAVTVTEEWQVTLRSDRAELLLVFALPQDYPPAPCGVSAVLTSRGSSGSGDAAVSTPAGGQPEPSDELSSATVTSMLQDQAARNVRVSALVPIAQKWLDGYTDRVVSLEQQRKADAERAAQEALAAALAEAEALEEARRALADGPTPFTRWLKRVGIKPPKAMRHGLADVEELFARKLALRKALPSARSTPVEPLQTLCIKVLGESLLRYESLAGYPLQMRQKILHYLATELRLLFPEHLRVLLDDEFTSLDFSGRISLGRNSRSRSRIRSKAEKADKADKADKAGKVEKANKTRDEHVKEVGLLCPQLKEINLSGAVRITNFSLSESIAKCVQLTRLVIDDCAQVGDMGVAVVASACPKLIKFSARRCLGITHNALHVLGRRCPQLEVVRIAGCTNIHVDGLLDLVRLAKQLQVLDAAEVGNNLFALNRDFPPVQPDRLANQRLERLILDRCNYVTHQFLQDLLGPLGQLCPRLTLLSLRQCLRMSNGIFEQVVLPQCPSLKGFHYSGVPHRSLHGVTDMDMSYLSFLPGCRYVFPIRSPALPPLLAQIRDQLLHSKRPDLYHQPTGKVFTQAELEKVVARCSTFLASIERFEANAPARRVLRGLESLTLAGVTDWSSPFSLIEAVISMPALRRLDLSHANVRLRDVLLSCYHFLPRLDTLVFTRRDDALDEDHPAFLKPQPGWWRAHTIDYYDERQRMFEQRERMLLEAQQQRQRRPADRAKAEAGDGAEAEAKRRQWVVDHIAGDDKRHSMSLTSLDVSGHKFADAAEFLDLIADRCPELRRLSLARTQGVGASTLLALLEKCVHLTHLDVRGVQDLPLHIQTDLRNKRPALTLHHTFEAENC